MGDFSLKPIIIGFVALLIGIVFVQVIADNQIANTTLSQAVNESITITGDTATIINETITMSSNNGNTLKRGIETVTFFGNVSNHTDLPGIDLGIDINFTRSGLIIVGNDADGPFTGNGPYNISYTALENATGDTANADVISFSFFGNANISTHVNDIDIGTEINFTKPGVVTVDPANFSAGDYNGSYSYEGALYVTDKKSHAFLSLNTLFFAIMVIAIAIGIILKQSDGFNFGFKSQ